MSHASFHDDGLPVAPSALSPDAKVWVVDPETGRGAMVDCPVPRALETAEISGIVDDYRRAAANARRAGFDGVEIHGGNGYLIDQFLRRSSNARTDEYGGDIPNRIRFAREVAAAVADEVGPERTGIRLSPFITQRNMADSEILDAFVALAEELDALNIAYIHLAEADWDDAPQVPDDFRVNLRATFAGAIIVAGNYTQTRAEGILNAALVDLVAFGRPFIANPDLPTRMKIGAPLADFDPTTLFGGDARGYSDYPPLTKEAAQ
jgi:N-ethylmaleimide reductase